MSGAPILDITRNLVIGLIAETWNAWGSFDDRDTAFATAMEVVQDEPFGLTLYAEVEKTSAIYPSNPPLYDLGVFATNGSSKQVEKLVIDPDLHALIEKEWGSIEKAWRSNETSYCKIIRDATTLGNENSKYSMDQVFLKLSKFPENERPKRILWWDFSTRPDFEELLDAILCLFHIVPGQIPSSELKLDLIFAFFKENRNLLVLNGLSSEILFPNDQNLDGLISRLVPGNSLCLSFF